MATSRPRRISRCVDSRPWSRTLARPRLVQPPGTVALPEVPARLGQVLPCHTCVNARPGPTHSPRPRVIGRWRRLRKIIGRIAFAIRHEFEQDSWNYEGHEFMVATLDGGPPRPILIPQLPTFAYSELYGLDSL